MNLYIIIPYLCVVTSTITLIIGLRIKNVTKEVMFLNLAFVFVFLYSVCYTMGLGCEDLSTAMLLHKLKVIASVEILLAMVLFGCHYCEKKINWKITFPFIVILGVENFAAAFFRHTSLYFKVFYYEPGNYGFLTVERGILYNLYLLTMLAGYFYIFFISAQRYIENRKKGKDGKPYLYLAISVCSSVFLGTCMQNICELPIDFWAVSYIVTEIILLFNIFRFHMFDVVVEVQSRTVEEMRMALLITDIYDGLLYANQKVYEIFPGLKACKRRESVFLYAPELEKVFLAKNQKEIKIWDGFFDGICTPIMNKGEVQGYSYSIFDITDRYLQEQKLEKLRLEAEEANQAKGLFMATMSHEIRTPLNTIIGLSEVMLKSDLEEKQTNMAYSIYSAGRVLLGTVNNVLDFSKIESGKYTLNESAYSFRDLVYDVVSLTFYNLYGRPIEFHVAVAPNVPKNLFGDAYAVKAVMLNVLSNSTKYTSKGRIDLRIDVKEKEGQMLLGVEVEDTGIGIKKENLKHIFGYYNQEIKEKTMKIQGTGVGLGVTKQLVELMDGEIGVESEEGKGSLFHFTFIQGKEGDECFCQTTITQEDVIAESRQKFRESEQASQYPDKTILVVDDMEVNLDVMRGILEPYEMRVVTAISGKEALAKIEGEEYDMVFMDQMMPEMDGFQTLKRIRENPANGQLPVVALTANAMNGMEEIFRKEGFQGYLTKPIKRKSLEKVLEEILGKKEQKIYINIEEGVRLAGGKRSIYEKVLASFIKELNLQREILEKLSQEDLDLFRIKVHGMKSSSYNIGCTYVSELARELEDAAKEERMTDIEEKLPKFLQSLTILQRLVERELKREEVSEKEEQEEVLTKEEIQALLEAFQSYDYDQMEALLEEHKKKVYRQKDRQILEKLRDYSEGLDYEEGIALLKSYEIQKNK